MKIYISGKMSGLPPVEVRQKFLAAKKQLLDDVDCQVYSPLDIAEGPTWEGNMIEDLKMLIKCNAIYMLSDWHDSPGATIEHAFARRMGLKIIYQN